MRPVGTAVVGQYSLDRDPTLGEPVDSSLQDANGSDSSLVVVDLGVRDAGVVVDHGVDVGVAQLGSAVLIAWLVRRGDAVAVALASADVAPATAVGDVPSFFTSTCTSDPGCACS